MPTMEATGDKMSSSLHKVDVTEELIESTFAPMFRLIGIISHHKVTVTEDENTHSVVEETDVDGVTANGASDASLLAITLKIFDSHNKTRFM